MILNHVVPGVGGHYLQAEMEKQKADALATWAAALTRIVGQTGWWHDRRQEGRQEEAPTDIGNDRRQGSRGRRPAWV